MRRNILDGVEALAALERFGTVTEAATRLRLTQSAVSKRLRALERAVGRPLVEADGRRLQITAEGLELLDRARPLLAGLRELLRPAPGGARSALTLALADSIAASWGPAVVAEAVRRVDVRVELHAHRSVLLVESVRLGRYQLGLSTDVPTPPDLLHDPVIEEPMVYVRGRPDARSAPGTPLVTIEPSSATWRAIEPALRRHRPELFARPTTPVESFGAALQMVKAGFGDGLVPLGMALEARLEARRYRVLEGVRRPVSLLTRKTVNVLASYTRLRDAIREAATAWFENARA